MDGLKQRIIGALVLVSLAVIFVPMVFDEPHSERTSTSIQIPEEPPFPEVSAPDAAPEAPPSYAEPAQDVPQSQTDGAASGESAPDYRLVEDEQEPFAGTPETDAPISAEPASSSEPASGPAASPEPAPSQAASSSQQAPQPQASDSESAEYTRSLKGAWVVQLGSFGNSDNARRLRDQVRDKGYGSHLQTVERGDTTLTRVFSGPFSSKADAEAAKRDLDNAFSLNSLVTTGDK